MHPHCIAANMAVPFFIICVCTINFVILNLLVAVIMQHFDEETSERDDDIPKLDENDLNLFTEKWGQLTPSPPFWKFWGEDGKTTHTRIYTHTHTYTYTETYYILAHLHT